MDGEYLLRNSKIKFFARLFDRFRSRFSVSFHLAFLFCFSKVIVSVNLMCKPTNSYSRADCSFYKLFNINMYANIYPETMIHNSQQQVICNCFCNVFKIYLKEMHI